MRTSACVCAVVSSIAAGAVLLFASDALAQTPNQPPPDSAPPGVNTPPPPLTTTPPPAVVGDPNGTPPAGARPRDPDKTDDEDNYKHIALSLNPLALAITRFSVTGDYVFAKHHALTVTPFFQNYAIEINNVKVATLSGFGGEVGYRLYTGNKGSNGFFIGPSFLFASFSQSLESGAAAGTKADSFTSIGGALDLGGQAIIGPGVIVGGGFGLQYTKTSLDINTDNFNFVGAAIAGGGVRPRFLLSVGFAF